uniref:Uncharacterized protein n=1 Tax=Solanum tuberosum TaxID=4113 RepID=M1ATU6_SOLTU
MGFFLQEIKHFIVASRILLCLIGTDKLICFSFLLCSFIGVPYLSDEPIFLQTKKACRVRKINKQLPINCTVYRQVILLELYEVKSGTDCSCSNTLTSIMPI